MYIASLFYDNCYTEAAKTTIITDPTAPKTIVVKYFQNVSPFLAYNRI